MQDDNGIAAFMAKLQVLAPYFIEHIIGLSPAAEQWQQFSSAHEYFLGDEIAASPMFDDEYYENEIHRRGLPPPAPGEALLRHWLRVGAAARVVPTPWFDEAFYLRCNPDVAELRLFGFVHFLLYGLHEGRRPTPWFDPEWYGAASAVASAAPAYLRFLTQGGPIGVSPSRGLRLLGWEGFDQPALLARCRALQDALAELSVSLDPPALDRLLGVFEPEVYRRAARLEPQVTETGALRHFLADGLWRGLPCGPLFDAAVYSQALQSGAAALPARARDEPALLHWARHGAEAGIVPVAWFDADFYLAAHPALRSAGGAAYTHFLDHGLFENRAPNAWFAPSGASAAARPGEPAFLGFLRLGRVDGGAAHRLLDGFALSEADLGTLTRLFPQIADTLAQLEAALPPGFLRIFHAMFVPDHYLRAAGLAADTGPVAALAHFLAHGLAAGIDPSPLFDAAVYRQGVALCGDLPPVGDTPPLLHFLHHGIWRRVTPTLRFDPAYYASRYDDLDADEVFGYEHFITHGLREGRTPTVWFDAAFCAARLPGDPAVPAYLRAWLGGLDQGVVASPLLARLLGEAVAPGVVTATSFTRLIATRGPAAAEDLDALLLLFVPEAYDGAGELPASADAQERLQHFLAIGLSRGDPIGPLLEPQTYLANLAHAGLPPPELPLPLHFARVGMARRILPCALFDEAAYLFFNPELAASGMWSFEHFLRHGLAEGRRFTRQGAAAIGGAGPAGEGPVARRRLLLAAGMVPVDTPAHEAGYLRWMLDSQQTLRRTLASPLVGEMMAQVREFEPGIGLLADAAAVMIPPFHDPIAQPHRDITARLAQLCYDTIVCVPWIRNGGADLVAGSLTHALRRTRPGERVLLLRTDNPHFDRPDWIAPDVDVLDISDILAAAGEAMAERLLYALFLGLAPGRVVTINSRLCWQTFRRFGARLCGGMHLYAYLFCWDQTPSGRRVGYPSDFYPDVAPWLTGVFTDTPYLKDTLRTMYRLPPSLAGRVTPLLSPARLAPVTPTMAERGAVSAALRPRPVVLWGGRLDHQKRFDIVEAVAWLMPHVDFLCWGAAMLDSGPDLSRLAPNIAMRGPFQALTDLPLGESDGWLFTSAWEGMPTTVIELATLGMPMVCSAVGGVPDLIDATTGWPVPPQAGPEAYAAAIEEMITRPDLRVARGVRVQAKATAMFTADAYDRSLDAVLRREAVMGQVLA